MNTAGKISIICLFIIIHVGFHTAMLGVPESTIVYTFAQIFGGWILMGTYVLLSTFGLSVLLDDQG